MKNKSEYIDFEASKKYILKREKSINRISSNQFNDLDDYIQKAITEDENAAEILKNFVEKKRYARQMIYGGENMNMLQTILFPIYSSLQKYVDVPVPPYTVWDKMDINATMGKNSKIIVLAFTSGLFTYSQLISKLFVEITYSENTQVIEVNLERMFKTIDYQKYRYREIVFNVAIGNVANTRPLILSENQMRVSYLLCDVMETFICAHEYAHVIIDYHELLEKCLEKSKREESPDLYEEMLADYLGALLSIKRLQDDRALPKELIAIGLFMAVEALHLLDLVNERIVNKPVEKDLPDLEDRFLSVLLALSDEKDMQNFGWEHLLFQKLWEDNQEVIKEIYEKYQDAFDKPAFFQSKDYKEFINWKDIENQHFNNFGKMLSRIMQNNSDATKGALEVLYAKNKIRISEGKYEDAIKSWEDAIKFYEVIEDEKKIGQVYSYLADIYSRTGQISQELECLCKALKNRKFDLERQGITLTELEFIDGLDLEHLNEKEIGEVLGIQEGVCFHLRNLLNLCEDKEIVETKIEENLIDEKTERDIARKMVAEYVSSNSNEIDEHYKLLKRLDEIQDALPSDVSEEQVTEMIDQCIENDSEDNFLKVFAIVKRKLEKEIDFQIIVTFQLLYSGENKHATEMFTLLLMQIESQRNEKKYYERCAIVYYGLAYASFNQKEYEDAEIYIEKAIQYFEILYEPIPMHADALFLSALIQMEMKNGDEVVRLLQDTLILIKRKFRDSKKELYQRVHELLSYL